MSKKAVKRKVEDLEKRRGICKKHIVWRNGDGTFTEKHWSREQLDEWEKSLPENDVVYVIGWKVTETLLPNGSGLIDVERTEEKHER